jgi:predicted negative regulator of RcsB-dependent stress response
VARITRKELKTDKFALEVGHTVDYFGEHRGQMLRYTGIALAVVAIALGIYLYRNHRRDIRQQELSKAMEIQSAPVGPAQGAPVSFPTQQAKEQEAIKAFSRVAAEYAGSDEGLIAQFYLGTIALDQGRTSEAEKFLKQVADSSNKRYASLAQLSLGQLEIAQGRAAEGEKMLRSLIAKPTDFVSKEQATVALARSLFRTKPAEARKLLEPLRTERSAVSQVAITLLSEMPNNP